MTPTIYDRFSQADNAKQFRHGRWFTFTHRGILARLKKHRQWFLDGGIEPACLLGNLHGCVATDNAVAPGPDNPVRTYELLLNHTATTRLTASVMTLLRDAGKLGYWRLPYTGGFMAKRWYEPDAGHENTVEALFRDCVRPFQLTKCEGVAFDALARARYGSEAFRLLDMFTNTNKAWGEPIPTDAGDGGVWLNWNINACITSNWYASHKAVALDWLANGGECIVMAHQNIASMKPVKRIDKLKALRALGFGIAFNIDWAIDAGVSAKEMIGG